MDAVGAMAVPGIVDASFAMLDVHSGYGLPIGGVAATDVDAGGLCLCPSSTRSPEGPGSSACTAMESDQGLPPGDLDLHEDLRAEGQLLGARRHTRFDGHGVVRARGARSARASSSACRARSRVARLSAARG